MTISVIIPTYNGAHKLPVILEALRKQTLQPNEIIIVVDGSTDHTKEVLDHYGVQIPNLKTFYQSNKGRAAVRNAGASKASGELLVFFDDDMEPEEHCIQKHAEHHSRISNSVLTGATPDKVSKNDKDIQQFKAWLSRKWTKTLKKSQGEPLQRNNIFLGAANFSISKELFFQLGGFDEQLTDAEDFDFAVRAFEKGVSLYYDHNAFAWHLDPMTGKKLIERQRQYRRALERLLELKPELYRQFSIVSQIPPRGLKKTFFSFFAKQFWVIWLDQTYFKAIIPRKLRYKIYDLIVTANGVFFPERVSV
jgi:glycosyltransferase involved in cell wall biosynthesis